MEDVLPSRKRGSEEVGLPDDPRLTPDAVVDMGFERGFVVDSATGWNRDDEEQMEEVQQRVRDEEPVLLIGSPMCRAFSTQIELTRLAGKLSGVKFRNLVK